MFQVSVEETFSAGHALRGYRGKCENVHGHNYRVRVTLEGPELDKVFNTEPGQPEPPAEKAAAAPPAAPAATEDKPAAVKSKTKKGLTDYWENPKPKQSPA